MTSRDLGYLRDIRDAAYRAISHIGGLSAELLGDRPDLADGPINLSVETRGVFPDIDWPGMIGVRNILVHRYHEIDYLELWTIVNRDLDPVIDQLTPYLERHP